MGISVVLLAANEAENLAVLFPRIISALEMTGTAYEILLVDSAVPVDQTPQICSKYEKVRYLNQDSPFYSGAFRTGIQNAREDHLLVLDADGSHDPSIIPTLYAKSMEGYDLVIGSRYCRGGKTLDSQLSIGMSKLLNAIMRPIIGVKARDISTSYRIYQTSQLKQITLTSKNYEILQEVILRMKIVKKDFTIAEVPIVFNKRIYGESKRRLLPFIMKYGQTLFAFIRIRMNK